MRLFTRETDYATRAITCIASSDVKIVTVTELTKKLNMPRPFLRKILQILNKEGILKSTKGSGGGFALALPPNRITLFKLINIFQGKISINEHTFKGQSCPALKTCLLKKKLDTIEYQLVSQLQTITIASLMKN